MCIKEIAKRKQVEYQNIYRQPSTPAIATEAVKIMTCDEVIKRYSTVEQLEEVEQLCRKKDKETNMPNSFAIIASVLREIIDEEKQNK